MKTKYLCVRLTANASVVFLCTTNYASNFEGRYRQKAFVPTAARRPLELP